MTKVRRTTGRVVERPNCARALRLGPRSVSFRLLIGNIAAFVPFGILLPLVVRTRWSAAVVLIGALWLCIELGQLAVS